MVTTINLEGGSLSSIANAQHVEATAQGKNVLLTIVSSTPEPPGLARVYVELTAAAADALLIELAPAVAQAAKHRAGK